MEKRLKAVIASSSDTSDLPGVFQVKYGGEFAARKFIPHITNFKDSPELISCQCLAFRGEYDLDFSRDIVGIFTFPSVLPELIDDASTYLNRELPKHDVLIAIGVHPDILTELIRKAADSGCRALIAPREDPSWMTGTFINTLKGICEENGIEYAFPRPFCSLSKTNSPIINSFIDQFRIGRPQYRLILDEDQCVTQVKVDRSSPCGATYHVAQGLVGIKKQRIVEEANNLWHSYPCLSSGKMDHELRDSIMHLGAYINMSSAKDSTKKVKGGNDMLIEKSCKDFIEVLASREPVPGGGGAAALVGSVGMALGNMVGNLTVGKKKYAEVESEVLKIMERAKVLQQDLLDMVDGDAKVFKKVSDVYKMPKETQEDIKAREEAMEIALKEACSVPLQIMKTSAEAIGLQARLGEIGSIMALSDVGVGVLCLKTALISGKLNVIINLNGIRDEAFVKKTYEEVDAVLEEAIKLADKTYADVEKRLKK